MTRTYTNNNNNNNNRGQFSNIVTLKIAIIGCIVKIIKSKENQLNI